MNKNTARLLSCFFAVSLVTNCIVYEEKLAPQEIERFLFIYRNGNEARISALLIDPDEKVALNVLDRDGNTLAVDIMQTNNSITITQEEDGTYIIEGSAQSSAVITFRTRRQSPQLVGTLAVFARNRNADEVIRTTLSADLSRQHLGPNGFIQQAGFDYESPEGLSTGGHHENTPAIHDAPHITQRFDEFLQRDVFAFTLHRYLDWCTVTGFADRQRVEFKTMDSRAPTSMFGTGGETFTHRWKFRLPETFAVSPTWTHIFQLKPENYPDEEAANANPTISLTARRRAGNDLLELTYWFPPGGTSNQRVLQTVPLEYFRGEWVYVEQTVTYITPSAGGEYSDLFNISIIRIRDGKKLIEYSTDIDLVMYRVGNRYIRPKWGLYRQIVNNNTEVEGLKDETILYADFEMDLWIGP